MKNTIRRSLLVSTLMAVVAVTTAHAQDARDFRRLDANGDGRINWREFQRGVLPYDELGLDRQGRYQRIDPRYGRDGRNGHTDETGRFERRPADRGTDRDARFERRDDVRADRWDERGRETRLSWPLEQMDRNRDGRISQGEYNQFIRAEFNRYDWNEDGVISRREFMEYGRWESDRRVRPGNRY